MREEIAQLTGLDLKTVKYLFDNHLISPDSAIRFIVKQEYYKIRESSNESNSQIYFNLSEKYRISESTVYKWITNY